MNFKLENNKIKLSKFIIVLFYIFTFFPYLKIIDLGTDTQINAFFISIVIVFIYGFEIKIPKEIKLLFLIMYISIIIGLFGMINFNFFRRVFNYITLFFVSFATYIVMNGQEEEKVEKYIKICINIWLVVGILQEITNQKFLTFLISGARTSATRGVLSLAPEPTYYGTMCIFFILLSIRFRKNRNLYIINCIVQIVFLAKSTMCTLILGLMLMIYGISKINKPYFIFIAVAVFLTSIVTYNTIEEYMPNSRLYSIIKELDNPMDLLVEDASINQRVGHIYYSLKGSIENLGLPNGYNKWIKYIEEQHNPYFPWVAPTISIMSGYGAAIFELGIIGIIIIIISFKSLKFYLKNKSNNIVFLLSLTLIMFTALPLSNPIYSFFIGYGLYLKKLKNISIIKSDNISRIEGE